MVAPIDYTTQVLNPFQAALQGVQAGVGLQNVQAQREAAQVKMMQQQQEMQRQQVLGEAMRGLTDKIRMGTAGQADFQQIALLAPKDQSEAALKIWDSMSKERQQGILSFGSQVMAALGSKNPQIGIDLLRERAASEKNTGNEEQASAYETWAKLAELDPANSQATIGGLLQGLPGGDKAIEAWTKVQQERRSQELQPLEIEAKRRQNVPTAIQEAIDYGKLTPEQQKTFQSIQVLKKPPAAVTNVSVTNLEKTASGELAKLLPDLYEQANSAASQLSDIPRYRKALESAITGPFAEQRLSAARVSNALGFTGDKGINATRELIQGNAEMALRARGLMKGQGQITEGEQKLLVKARAGEIDFSKGELQTLFNVFERASKAQYERSTNLMRSAAGKSETAQMFLDNVSPLPSEEPPKQPAQPAAGAANIRSQADAIIRGGR
jgi:hypothetical protein